MTRFHVAFPVFVCSLLAFAPIGCDKSEDDDDDGADDEDEGSESDGAADDQDESDDSGDDGTGTDEPKEDGAVCAADAECLSGKCYMGIWSYCGECATDADCPEGGCSPPNALSVPVKPSACNMGELGGGCMSNEVCQSMICAPIIEVAGEPVSGCSDCLADTDCTGGQLCSPSLDVEAFSGYRTCVDPGSLADGEGCDFEGSGAEACQNYCALTTELGGAQIGICGECNPDDNAGCETGEICQRGSIDIINLALVPATCMPE